MNMKIYILLHVLTLSVLAQSAKIVPGEGGKVPEETRNSSDRVTKGILLVV